MTVDDRVLLGEQPSSTLKLSLVPLFQRSPGSIQRRGDAALGQVNLTL
jgi:hypothetical protein